MNNPVYPLQNEQAVIANVIYDDIYIGQSASHTRTLTRADILAFAAISGDVNPAHLDSEYADHTLFHGVIAHGMWGGALISTILGTQLPGPGTIYLEQTLHFSKPVRIGDVLTISATVVSKDDLKKRVTLDCHIINQDGVTVVAGNALVIAPTESVRRTRSSLPTLALFDLGARQQALIASVHQLAPVRCAVVHPCDADSLQGALDAARAGLIIAVLIAPKARLQAVAAAAGLDLAGIEIIDVAHSHAAADKAVELAAAGAVEALMKGSLHTDELMSAVVHCAGLKTKRRLSHVFHLDAPMYHKALLLTDAALNIAPNLAEKADILQNAIELAHALGIAVPKVAILSALETINPKIPSTIDAAALCKMADRGQISGAIIDGPLAFDNAISAAAARVKGIVSAVAGEVDILMVPDLESGNMLAKQFEYLAGAATCGIVLGARVPIALTSRADGASARVASAALVKLLAHEYRKNAP
ncbi:MULTISPECIES: bifunctional enoyl-CoA hydratase/phosphate acetyltransferase [unclassified Undibacterium]|uniref:bifunctional enoyl-CoA hydratase/phosphate acetyltransferase n=1 Tax=unclassified Undibacterium TaxID=2630295 RepID=UPI002AC92A41|nr:MULTISPECIES: bifunctional enoyl-CoA hydratase/phosphate acetyltransferase [unclassified Undibacterium]MEB0137597.1 bifunctional enoyl-CoA hydratase/phosphate acetyltransferase [Undibacterium sp. CCC2.1]MEB0170598.1 bifunctional enoyl-CoA hydratase/phosphate acetyltransferase [Undibacterium sp. CCC1.1]MEB0174539.1 bifunctional enoyl-CoA hydratase/phosphate acetyltransferase [Undibacterium sp. CCC3.4]MEB0213664.1 bifunctional enoyl-CoA hydratase/phosphate acetyltransferase [Undibacterium sp. 